MKQAEKLLVMDVDSTLIEEEVIDLLGQVAGRGPEIAAVTAAAMRGELDFKAALQERLSVLTGLSEAVFETVRAQIHLTKGARELIEAAHARNWKVGLVSGGFHEIIDPLTQALGIDFVLANHLEVANGFLTGKSRGLVVDKAVKLATIKAWAQQLNLTLADVIAMGDGANDLPMIEAAGIGIAFCAKPVVAARAPYQICERNLLKVLEIVDKIESEET